MTNLELIEKITNAWETTTHNFNRFAECVKGIEWDETFEADGETYHVYGDITFITESLEPFAKTFNKPCFLTKTGVIYI